MTDEANSSANPDYVTCEVRDSIAWVMLNRPEYANTQNYRLLNRLDDVFKQVVEDPEVRVIVLGGNGKHFSAGHDLGTPEYDRLMPRERKLLWYDHLELEGAESQYALEQDVFLGFCRRWQEIPKPMIAMVQGACVAGGLMLAWICDLILASDDAFFADPVLRMGIPGVEYFAHPYVLGARQAKEFLFLGEKLGAERALALGMINRVFPRTALLDETWAIARRIAEMPRFGLALAKKAINQAEDRMGLRDSMDATFALHHVAHAHNTLTSPDHLSGQDVQSMKSWTSR